MLMKMNKTIAGYHILMILSAVDNKFTPGEDRVIADYMERSTPFKINLDSEMEILSALSPGDYMVHFQKAMAHFYEDSTETERNELITFAIKLAKSDKVISREENIFIDELFNEWTETKIS